MKEFEELEAPQEAAAGWYVVAADSGCNYLHDDGEIHFGTDGLPFSFGFFKSEIAAYIEAELYYLNHARKYPHSYKPVSLDTTKEVPLESEKLDF